jgi:glucosamine kinase
LNNTSILIADSGSTKTDWLFAVDGNSMVQFQSAGMNPFYQNKEEITALLVKEVIPNLKGEVGNIFFYGAGCADEKTSKPVYDALLETIRSAEKIEVASDMLGAARGLCGHEPGIACILGTGANNASYDGKEIIASIGSLGFWLGDEGSGSYLGKTLIVHFLQNELPKDLHALFELEYPEINRLSVLENAYRKPFPNRYFATFSKFISANIGNAFVHQMVHDAFDRFIEKYVIKHAIATNYPVHFTGSVAFYYQDILTDCLARQHLTVGKILKSPMTGLATYHFY